MIDVLLVDDHAIVRHGLSELFATTDDISVVAQAADGETALALVDEHRPDVVLMDLSMPGLDGVEATRRIVQRHPASAVVVLTSFGERSRILAALDAGAVGYLLKHVDPEIILDGVRATAAGGAPLDPRAAQVLLQAGLTREDADHGLTTREREVLRQLTRGLSNRKIAESLGITERTVKAHLTSAFQRIGASDRTQAALWAQEHLVSD